jgi:hypothetical protein
VKRFDGASLVITRIQEKMAHTKDRGEKAELEAVVKRLWPLAELK